MMTLKEIALELLDKYESAERCANDEYSLDPAASREHLNEEIAKYKDAIEEAAQ